MSLATTKVKNKLLYPSKLIKKVNNLLCYLNNSPKVHIQPKKAPLWPGQLGQVGQIKFVSDIWRHNWCLFYYFPDKIYIRANLWMKFRVFHYNLCVCVCVFGVSCVSFVYFCGSMQGVCANLRVRVKSVTFFLLSKSIDMEKTDEIKKK